MPYYPLFHHTIHDVETFQHYAPPAIQDLLPLRHARMAESAIAAGRIKTTEE